MSGIIEPIRDAIRKALAEYPNAEQGGLNIPIQVEEAVMREVKAALPKTYIDELEEALASAALSLLSYECSCGGGGGQREAFEIARLLGYEGDLTDKDVGDWLQERAS